MNNPWGVTVTAQQSLGDYSFSLLFFPNPKQAEKKVVPGSPDMGEHKVIGELALEHEQLGWYFCNPDGGTVLKIRCKKCPSQLYCYNTRWIPIEMKLDNTCSIIRTFCRMLRDRGKLLDALTLHEPSLRPSPPPRVFDWWAFERQRHELFQELGDFWWSPGGPLTLERAWEYNTGVRTFDVTKTLCL